MQEVPQRRRRSQRGGAPVHRAPYPEERAQDSGYPEYPEYPVYTTAAPPSSPPRVNPYQRPAPPYQAPRMQQPYPPQPVNAAPRFHNGGAQPPVPPYQQEPAPRRGGRSSRDGVWLLVIIACIVLLVAGGFAVSSLQSRAAVFAKKRAMLNVNTFYNGVHVDDVHIGGLTREQARLALQQTSGERDRQYALSVNIDGKVWSITQDQLPLSRNIDAVLDAAYAIGRQGTLDTLKNGQTPFEERYRMAQSVNQNGAYLYTGVTYDRATARELAEKLASFVNIPAQNATVYSFDFSSRSFQYQGEVTGAYLSSETIYNAIVAKIDSMSDAKQASGTVALHTQPQQPQITLAQLQQSFGKIASYSTTTLADKNRNINIELACKAVTGTVESGDTFSFNEATGRRTVEKGYQPAGAIALGANVQEYGGGVCQVSSTLFNAAAMANMEIVYSSPHAWPSTYVDPGRDATVDWQTWQSLSQSLDFKFKNASDYPIFIVAYLTGKSYSKAMTCTVEIYGVALNDGVSISLQTQLMSSTPEPLEVERRLNTELPYGTENVVRKARPGYVYDTYRVFYQNGVEVYREKLRTSTYRTYTQLVEYNY